MYPGLVPVRAFEVSVTKEEGFRPLAFLQNPILITVQLNAADLSLAGGVDSLNEMGPQSNFDQPVVLHHYRGNQWEGTPKDTQVNRDTLTVESRMPRLGLYALTIVDRNPTTPTRDP